MIVKERLGSSITRFCQEFEVSPGCFVQLSSAEEGAMKTSLDETAQELSQLYLPELLLSYHVIPITRTLLRNYHY